MTDAARGELAESWFRRALDRPQPEREAILAAIPEPGLRDEVRALLAAHAAAATGVLEEAPAATGAPPPDPVALGLDRGWRVIRELARGGMGVVYLAERADGAYQQQVVLKLLRPDAFASPEALLRLKLERQILARLNHPNIARLLDGGTSASGVPYLVIEYIDGQRLDEWCQRSAPSLVQRLALFERILDAVAHAHRHLVVHRDLKPGNILVDREGEPHLIDFGIARELAGDGGLTQTGQRLLTPRYASPEQVRGEPATTASDIYSLGVVFYELLTGQSPYGERAGAVHGLADAILTLPPPLPSAASSRAAGAAEGVPPLAPSQLRGDLDAIVLKCLEKDPARRYPGIEALAADLAAYQAGRPVAARRGNRLYVARRFLRRHWAALATAGAVLALATSFVFGLRAQLEETRRERDRHAHTLAFVTELFRIADPSEARGNSITVREVLDRSAGLLAADRTLDDVVRADLGLTLGNVYRQLGLYGPAETSLESALASAGALPPRDRAALHLALAATRVEQARFDEALAELERSGALLPAAGEPLLRARIDFLKAYVALRQGHGEQAGPLADAALATLRSIEPVPTRELADALALRGSVDRDRGQLDAATARYRDALAVLEAQGADPWLRARIHNNLAVVAVDQGRMDEAEALLGEALALIRSAVGDDNPATATALVNVAAIKSRRGDNAEAARLFGDALSIRERRLGAQHPQTVLVRGNLAYLEYAEGRIEEARAHIEDAATAMIGTLGAGNPMTVSTRRNRAAIRFAQGEVEAAIAESRALREEAETAMGRDHPLLLQARVRELAWACLADAGCDRGALLSAGEDHVAKLGPGHAEAGESLALIAAVDVLSEPGAACAEGRAARRLKEASADLAPWDRALWQWAAGHCGDGDPQAARAALAARYGERHPLLTRLDGA